MCGLMKELDVCLEQLVLRMFYSLGKVGVLKSYKRLNFVEKRGWIRRLSDVGNYLSLFICVVSTLFIFICPSYGSAFRRFIRLIFLSVYSPQSVEVI